MVTTTFQITIAVHVDGSGVHQVTVKENAPVMSVIFKAAQVAGTHLTLNSSLFEVEETLKIGTYGVVYSPPCIIETSFSFPQCVSWRTTC